MSPRLVRGVVVAIMGAAAASCSKSSNEGSAPPSQADGAYVPTSIGQYLIDGSTVQVSDGPNGAAVVHVALPTGSTSDTTIAFGPGRTSLASLAPAPGGTPLRDFQLSHTLGPEGMTWNMRYVVPVATVPSDALALFRPPRPFGRAIDAATAALLGERIAYADDDSGVVVLLDGVLGEMKNEVLSQLEDHYSPTDLPLVQGADVLSSIAQALERNEQYTKLEQHLDDLRKCAENPTNPLTQKMYADDPSSKQHVLDEIDDVEREVRMDLLVRFVGALNGKAAGLGPKWLGFVVGPVTSWADAGIAATSATRVAQLDALVLPSCNGGSAAWSGTITFRYDGMKQTSTSTDTDDATVHFEDTITVTGLTVNMPGGTAAEKANESYTRHMYHTGTCADGSKMTSTIDTQSSGSLDSASSATVYMLATNGTYTLAVDFGQFTGMGTVHDVEYKPGSCVGNPSLPPQTSDTTQPISWTISGGSKTLTGDLDPKSPPAQLTGSQPFQGQSAEGVPVTGTITWTLQRP